MTPEEKQQVIEETERDIAEWLREKWDGENKVAIGQTVHQVRNGLWRERPPVTLTLPWELAAGLVKTLASVPGPIGLLPQLRELIAEAMKVDPEEARPEEPWFAVGDEVNFRGSDGVTGVVVAVDRISGIRVRWPTKGRTWVWYAPEKLEKAPEETEPKECGCLGGITYHAMDCKKLIADSDPRECLECGSTDKCEPGEIRHFAYCATGGTVP